MLEAGEQMESNAVLKAVVDNMDAFAYDDADQNLLMEKCVNLVHNGCLLSEVLEILLKLQNVYSLVPCYEQLSE